MSERLTAPVEFDELSTRIESTSELARHADELYEPKSIQESRLYDGHQRYDSRDPLPSGHSESEESRFLALGTERHNPSHEVTQANTPEQRTITAGVEKEKKRVMVNAERLAGKYNDVMRQETPGYKANAASSLTEDRETGSITATSTLEVKGVRHGKNVEKKLESDNPLVARMIADIALKEIREKSAARINGRRKEHQSRWEAEALQANKERPILDKVRGKNEVAAEDVMQEEAYQENEVHDNIEADKKATLKSFATTLDQIKDLPESESKN